MISEVYNCTNWNLYWEYHSTLHSHNLKPTTFVSYNLISEVYTCTIWNLCWQYYSVLQLHNLNRTTFIQLDHRGLHLHNLKSLLTVSFYTIISQTESHYIRTTWFQRFTPAQPEIFADNITVHYICTNWFSLYLYNLISRFYTCTIWNLYLYGKVTYFTLHLHTLIFITLLKHDFSGSQFLLCVHVSSQIHICTYIFV